MTSPKHLELIADFRFPAAVRADIGKDCTFTRVGTATGILETFVSVMVTCLAVWGWLQQPKSTYAKIGGAVERKRFRVLSVAAFCLFSVGMLMAQSTGAAVAQPTLTPEERAAALKSLQATHDAFLQSIAGLSEKQWKFKPAPDRWSIAEVSEHITVAEGMILGLVQEKIMSGP